MDTETLSFDEASNQDEVFMRQSLQFSENLKDLKNLREQLFRAAAYFEESYSKQDNKQLVMETLKDYTTKALISTVDHLGTVAYKVNTFVDEKIGDASVTQLRYSCVEQRLQSCLEFINQGGITQQSLAIEAPKYHKRYKLFQEVDAIEAIDTTKRKHHRRNSSYYQVQQFKNAVQATIIGKSPSNSREGHFSTKQSPRFLAKETTFMFTKFPLTLSQASESKAVSPQRFPFFRTTSVVRRSSSPENPDARKRYPTAPRRSYSLSAYKNEGERRAKDEEQYSTKSKRLFKAMLSLRKPRKDDSLYNYLDDR